MYTLAIKVAPYFETPIQRQPRWQLDFVRKMKPDFTVLVRMNPENGAALDFLLLPPQMIPRLVHLGGRSLATYEPYRCETLDQLVAWLIANVRGSLANRAPIA